MMEPRNHVITNILILTWICWLHIPGSDSLQDVQLEGPSYIRLGENLKLRCSFKLEPNESIYAVKWYRGAEEFYRYLPKEHPPQQVFPVNGIIVDLNGSDDHIVILRNASISTNGKFRCQVSAEATFQTLVGVKNISTVVIGYQPPRISLDKKSYHPGEVGMANCTLEKTYPPASIVWYINDKQPESRHVLPRVVPWDPSVPSSPPSPVPLTTTESRLIFNVSNNYSPLHIKCEAELFDIYRETTAVRIQPQTRDMSYSSSYGTGGTLDPLQRMNKTFLRGSGSSLTLILLGESNLSHLLTAQLFLGFHTFVGRNLLSS